MLKGYMLVWGKWFTWYQSCENTTILPFGMSSIYVWSENSSPKSEDKMAEIEELLNVSSSPFLLFKVFSG
jgi:hypothetical protein